MDDDKVLYQSRIVERRLVNSLKIYVSGTDKFSVQEDRIEPSIKILQRNNNALRTGFAILFPGSSVKIGLINENQRSFNMKYFRFKEYGHRDKLYTESGNLEALCYLDCEIIGGESKILRESKNKEDYLSTWVMQDDFVRKNGFRL